MLVKRLYTDGRVTGLAIGHSGIRAEQNFSSKFVEEAALSGAARIDGDVLTITCQDHGGADIDLRYTILRGPGYYCCHDGSPIPISALAQREAASGIARLAAKEAAAYLAANGFDGKQSPDAQNPSGYRVVRGYECVLDAKQHTRYRLPDGVQPALALSFDHVRAVRAQEK